MFVRSSSKFLHLHNFFGREYLITHKAQGNNVQRQQQGNEVTNKGQRGGEEGYVLEMARQGIGHKGSKA